MCRARPSNQVSAKAGEFHLAGFAEAMTIAAANDRRRLVDFTFKDKSGTNGAEAFRYWMLMAFIRLA